MEQAIFISKIKNLNYVTDKYSRLYFGVEFCESLIPTIEDLEQVLSFISKKGLSLTLVTPYLTDNGIGKLKPLIKFLIDEQLDSEIVVNDWGLLRLLKKEYRDSDFELALGRLLTKQKKDPRILNLTGKIPQGAIEHFMMSNVDVPILVNFLMNKGIRHVELDNLFQGLSRQNPQIKGSLYIPFVYVTTTKLCLANLGEKKSASLRVVSTCNKECQKYTFKLQHTRMPVDLFLKGNTIFFKNNRLPENLEELNIDRLVYQPEIPV